MGKNNFLKLIVSILIPQIAGIVGSLFTFPQIDSGWYGSLVKPEFSPPSWIFGPVWTTLFILMGIAFFLVWKKGVDSELTRIAVTIFSTQLVLNILWSFIFFTMQSPGGAFFEIIILWLAIFYTIYIFAKISKVTVWLLLPYILWVSFAGYLNYTIWMLN